MTVNMLTALDGLQSSCLALAWSSRVNLLGPHYVYTCFRLYLFVPQSAKYIPCYPDVDVFKMTSGNISSRRTQHTASAGCEAAWLEQAEIGPHWTACTLVWVVCLDCAKYVF